MLNSNQPTRLKLTALTVLILLALVGCSAMKLGDIDETPDEREEMPGPGIFSDTSGETTLSWTSDKKDNRSRAQSSTDGNEFELFKQWQLLKKQGENSLDYREFQRWLEFQKSKHNDNLMYPEN